MILLCSHVTKVSDIFIYDIHLNLFWNIFFEWTLLFSCVSRLRRNNKSILFPFSKQKKSLFEYSGARTDSLAQLDRKNKLFLSPAVEDNLSNGVTNKVSAEANWKSLRKRIFFFCATFKSSLQLLDQAGRCVSYTTRDFSRFWWVQICFRFLFFLFLIFLASHPKNICTLARRHSGGGQRSLPRTFAYIAYVACVNGMCV